MADPTYDDSEEDMSPAATAADSGDESTSRTMPTRPGQATSGVAKKAPMVTKEELAASGLSLRDYLNKQQGLTRRGGGAPSASSTPNDRAESRAIRDTIAKSDLESGKSTVQRQDATKVSKRPGVDLTSPFSALRSLSQGTKRGGGSYAKGGSVSSASKRADGIATKGKTRGTMIMCGGGMTKR